MSAEWVIRTVDSSKFLFEALGLNMILFRDKDLSQGN